MTPEDEQKEETPAFTCGTAVWRPAVKRRAGLAAARPYLAEAVRLK